MMSGWNLIGYLAAGLVLVSFYQTRMIPLRIAAIGSNFAFIVYGLALGLMPVWVLHIVLLPLNARRLVEEWRARQRPSREGTCEGALAPRARRFLLSFHAWGPRDR